MKYRYPLVSCICITGNRPLVLQRAIACFEKQDYPKTELIISYPEKDILTKTVIDQMTRNSNMKTTLIERVQEEGIALTRNNAINAANGDYICIWHHEHWHHVNRISDQYRAIKDGPFKASMLMHILLFDFQNQQTYHSVYWEWQETLLCEKQLMLQGSYIDIERTDDSSIIHFLSSRNVLYHISQAPHLYIYIYYENRYSVNFLHKPCFSKSESLADINETVKGVISINNYISGGI